MFNNGYQNILFWARVVTDSKLGFGPGSEGSKQPFAKSIKEKHAMRNLKFLRTM